MMRLVVGKSQGLFSWCLTLPGSTNGASATCNATLGISDTNYESERECVCINIALLQNAIREGGRMTNPHCPMPKDIDKNE
jgi:hypothetical protein